MLDLGPMELALILPTLGIGELLIILLIIVVLFGASRLPQLGGGLGEGIRNFKQGLRGDDRLEAGNTDSSTSTSSETDR